MSIFPAHRIESFEKAPASVRRAVADMTREQLVSRPVPGKWSTLEVVCHLVDSDQAWCHRMKRVIAEEKPLLIGYAESQFTSSLFYHDRELEDELAMLDAMRRQMGQILRSIAQPAWVRVGIHNERGLVTLAEMLDIETEHVAHHVGTILEKRRALGLPESG